MTLVIYLSGYEKNPSHIYRNKLLIYSNFPHGVSGVMFEVWRTFKNCELL